ncbi:hypothetical protein GCM10025787_57170 [Saccharopolyspora rosea]
MSATHAADSTAETGPSTVRRRPVARTTSAATLFHTAHTVPTAVPTCAIASPTRINGRSL